MIKTTKLKLSKIKTFNQYIFLIESTIDSLSKQFEEIFNYSDIQKLYDVFIIQFSSYTKDLEADKEYNEVERKKYFEIFVPIFIKCAKRSRQPVQERIKEYFSSYASIEKEFKETNFHNKDASQIQFSTNQIYSLFLYPEKKPYDLMAETLFLIESNIILGILAKQQRDFLDKNKTKDGETMILLNDVDFFAETWGGRPNRMDVSIYDGYPVDCACGETHLFNSLTTHVIRELSGRRLVLTCPENDGYATCVKLKGWLWFRGFKSLFGTKIDEEAEENTDELDFMSKVVEKVQKNYS